MANPIILIAACAENRVIGIGGRLPFEIPEDRAWFHARTAGRTAILGRVSFESWPAALDDGRRPVVITSHPELVPQRGPPAARAQFPMFAAGVGEALAIAQTLPGEILVCGGQRVYEETLPLADQLLLTLVHATLPGDTWFPEWRGLPWRERARRESASFRYRYTFLELERRRSDRIDRGGEAD